MTRILGPTGSGRRRRALFGAVSAAVLVLALMPPAQADLNRSLFELDKNAQDDVTTFRDIIPPIVSGPLGVLNAAVSVSSTSIQVCQFANNNGTFLDPTGETILIDAERIEVGGFTTASGGGCPSGSTKRNYTPLTRTTPAAHSNGERVTRLTFDEVAGSDWDAVKAALDGGDDKCTTLDAVECAFAPDGRATSIFTSSKDYDEIEDWQWRDQSVPDADELDDGFAIKYVDGDGDQQLYFGADRAATNGSKDMGFWFFHDTVTPIPPANGGDGTFDGSHTAPSGTSSGDILILSTFTNGGAVTTIRVFEWVGPGGSTAALATRGNAGDCVPGNLTDDLCATVNDTTIESPWNYIGKGEPVGNEISAGGFLEGGVNLSDLGLEGCFSSFMATSRSSPSLTADPKDFILGNFEACGATITTDASDDSFEIGGSVTDSATVTVTGGGPAPTGFVDFFVCGPEDDINSCDENGTLVSSEDLADATVANGNEYTVTSDSVTPTEAGDYCFFAIYGAGQDDNYPDGATLTDFTDECFTVTPNQPTISTQVNDAGPLPLGSVLDDTATLANTADKPNGDPAGGTITFTAYGPHDNTTTCTTVAYTSVVAVSGDGDYTASAGDADGDDVPGEVPDDQFIPTEAGTYNWIAVYSGDPPNTLGVSGACGDANEGSVIISLQPGISTSQYFFPNDSASITVGSGGGDLEGTVDFQLFDNDQCSGEVLYEELGIDITLGGTQTGTDLTVSTDNTTFLVDASGPLELWWKVTYHSDNPAHQGALSDCVEDSTLTINNS